MSVRVRRTISLLALIGIVLLAGACSQPEIQALTFGDVPWQDGEVSSYRVTAVDKQYAGTARYDMTLSAENVWNLRREITAQGTQEIVAVEMRLPGFRPSQATLVRMDNDGVEQVRTTYDQGQVDLELTTKLNVTTLQRVNVPSDVRDQRTLLMLLRALPLAPNYAVQINSFLPVVPLLERVTVVGKGQEQVTVPAGQFDAFHVVVEGKEVKTEAWIGVDAPHPLLRYVDGFNGATFDLLEYVPAP